MLDEAERAELRSALTSLSARTPRLTEIQKEAFPMPRVEAGSLAWRDALRRGRGFVLVRGVPVEGATRDDLARLYWLLGLHLGTPAPQNTAGELLCDVRDTGADPHDPETRLYTTRAEQDFHTDGADIIGLLCLKTAKSGGASRLVSSVRVFEEVRAKRPDLAPLLFEPWHFRLPGATEGMPRTFAMPICRWDGRNLATFFIAWYIRHAQLLPDVPRLSPAQEELLVLYESVANDPRLTLDMRFEPGDVQWLKNSVVLHKRTEYEDWPEDDRKRHLLRLWLAAPDFEDGDLRLRRGVVKQNADEAVPQTEMCHSSAGS
ncbi:TauD/TfdA family dioxygenase [Polyangium sp. 6x1]|nr:TauD/TfdA family dioxygenase [Polyangium sp. 6x1]